jgi:hypothetical protein
MSFVETFSYVIELLQTPGLYQVEISESDNEGNDRRFYSKFIFA